MPPALSHFCVCSLGAVGKVHPKTQHLPTHVPETSGSSRQYPPSQARPRPRAAPHPVPARPAWGRPGPPREQSQPGLWACVLVTAAGTLGAQHETAAPKPGHSGAAPAPAATKRVIGMSKIDRRRPGRPLRSGRGRAGGEPCVKHAMAPGGTGGRAGSRRSRSAQGRARTARDPAARPPVPAAAPARVRTPSSSSFAPTGTLPLVTPEAEVLVKAERLLPLPAPSTHAWPWPLPAHSGHRAGHTRAQRYASLGLGNSSRGIAPGPHRVAVRGTGGKARRLCLALATGGPVPTARVRGQAWEDQPVSHPATEPAPARPASCACPRLTLGPRGKAPAPGQRTHLGKANGLREEVGQSKRETRGMHSPWLAARTGFPGQGDRGLSQVPSCRRREGVGLQVGADSAGLGLRVSWSYSQRKDGAGVCTVPDP